MDDKVEVQNVNHPEYRGRLDRAKYDAMKLALMAVIPEQTPGMTVAELQIALLPHLDSTLFPGGAKSMWWLKSVHLDLEAKGVLCRANKPPVRLWLV